MTERKSETLLANKIASWQKCLIERCAADGLDPQDDALICDMYAAENDARSLERRLQQAVELLAIAREALAFYADERNWTQDTVDIGVGEQSIPFSSTIEMTDRGRQATEALARME